MRSKSYKGKDLRVQLACVLGMMFQVRVMAKILTVRMLEQKGGIGLIVELGEVEIAKTMANGEGLVRLAAILDDSGKLVDVELVTDKPK